MTVGPQRKCYLEMLDFILSISNHSLKSGDESILYKPIFDVNLSQVRRIPILGEG